MLAYLITLLSFGYCLAVPIIWQIGATVENQNGTVLTLTRNVDDLEVIDVGSGIVYTVSKEKKSYIDAEYSCKQSGMELIKVDSPKKNEAVKLLIETFTTEGPFWMGAVWLGGDKWKWPKGKRIDGYYWDEGEPNNAKGDERCIQLYHRDALWNDQSCSEENYFICELHLRKKLSQPGTDRSSHKSNTVPSRRLAGKDHTLS